MEAVTKFRKKWLTCRIIEMPGTFSPRTPPDSKVFAWKLIADGWSSLTFIEDSTVKIKREWLKFIVFSLANSSFDPSAYRLFILMTLLRNICGLALPVTGWDVLPAATDLSREADIARVINTSGIQCTPMVSTLLLMTRRLTHTGRKSETL